MRSVGEADNTRSPRDTHTCVRISQRDRHHPHHHTQRYTPPPLHKTTHRPNQIHEYIGETATAYPQFDLWRVTVTCELLGGWGGINLSRRRRAAPTPNVGRINGEGRGGRYLESVPAYGGFGGERVFVLQVGYFLGVGLLLCSLFCIVVFVRETQLEKGKVCE